MTVASAAPIRCQEWGSCDAADVVPLVDAEVHAWRSTLAWDVADAWSVVEPARQTGQLPGFVAFDGDGHIVGWTAFLPHRGCLQVMALAASDAATATTLVDGILESAGQHGCASTMFCVRDATPHLVGVLQRREFVVDPYRYLTRALDGGAVTSSAFAPWRAHDEAMAALCALAYRDAQGVRAFAPGGTLAEWRQYVATLTHGTGCGWFLPELSFVLPAESGRLQAAIMLTDLGTGTAHIAQLAVDPAARGRGLGRQLVERVLAEAGLFYDQLSLLVSGANTPAVRLYESLGFRDHAQFIVASRATTACGSR